MSASITVAVLVGCLGGALGSGGRWQAIAFIGAVALPFVFWKAPGVGVLTLLGCATSIEQFRYSIGSTQLDAFTDRVPIFASLSDGLGLQGVSVNPFELALFSVILVWLMRGIAEHDLHLPRSHMAAAQALLLLLVMVALAAGLVGGGDSRAALWEIRPWIYLAATFLLASQLLTTRRALRSMLWVFVVGSGFKALTGVIIMWQARSLQPPPEAILAHEEAFFFAVFVILTLGLWIFSERGRLRTVATILLPLVILADLGNDRRTAWLMLGIDVTVMLILAYVVLPERRPLLRRLAVVLALAGAIYLPLFWDRGGTLAQPARALRSAIAPDGRDLASNQYRKLEDANLGVSIRNSPLMGTGLGVPIQYPIPIVDISNVDSFIRYVPHNGVLYVWMRMGPAGELALWFLVASALIVGCRLLTSTSREVSLLGAVSACAVVSWVIEGYNDMGFYWFRIAIAMGCLLGLMQAIAARDHSPGPQDPARTRAA